MVMWMKAYGLRALGLALALVLGHAEVAHAQYTILLGADPNRSNPTFLDGSIATDDIYVFVAPEAGIDEVRFFLDDPNRTGSFFKRETNAPYDLAGSNPQGQANPFDTKSRGDGSHMITAEIDLAAGGTDVIHAGFVISNAGPSLEFSPGTLFFALDPNQTDSTTVGLDTSNAAIANFNLSGSAGWLSLSFGNSDTPETITVDVDTAGLSPGTYNALVNASAAGFGDDVLDITLQVGAPPGGFDIMLSTSPTRAPAVPLSGQAVTENIYVFTTPEAGVDKVIFSLDGAVVKTETNPPFDLTGSGAGGLAAPFDTLAEIDGPHLIIAEIILDGGGSIFIQAPFTIANSAPAMLFTPDSVNINLNPSSIASLVVGLDTSDLSDANFSITENETWLTVTPPTGTTPQSVQLDFDSTGLPDGIYNTSVTAQAPGLLPDTLAVMMTVGTPVTLTTLMLAFDPNRAPAVPLDGSVLDSDVYIFTAPDTNVDRVVFLLDGLVFSTENTAPFDFAGTSGGIPLPFDSTTLSSGQHVISAQVEFNDNSMEVINATVSTADSVSALNFDVPNLSIQVQDPNINPFASDSSLLSTNDANSADFTITENASWLSIDPNTGITPNTINFDIDATGLVEGLYSTIVTASSSTHVSDQLVVQLNVGVLTCGLIPCTQVRVDDPFSLTFDETEGQILDKNGIGTGFTWIQEPSAGVGYLPNNLEVDIPSGVFKITTTAGIFKGTNNNDGDNVIGVGVDIPAHIPILETTMVNIPLGTGNFEQAGLWFGLDEDNYHKIAIVSRPEGAVIEHHQEQAGINVDRVLSPVVSITGVDVTLTFRLEPDPNNGQGFVTSEYRIGGGLPTTLATFVSPGTWFGEDQAGISPPELGTRSFGGVFATHRKGPASLVYSFDSFSILNEADLPEESSFQFVEHSFDQFFPTAMVYGPDDRLYVVDVSGTIRAYTLDPNDQPINTEVILPGLGSRLALGLTIDPNSDPNNVILLAAHSDLSQSNGATNSSKVTRLSGPNLSVVEDIITGLPRAIANHAINHIHFGPDGRLYIANGGNTGAGAHNELPLGPSNEFGQMVEQPLSAALLVADIADPNFDGTCANDPNNITAPNPCDVTTYSTGLRNMYDFWFHSNGQIYGTENGLGVVGSFPPTSVPICDGQASSLPVAQGGDNPGKQPDLLHRLQEGKYYGHPNPSRDECVFKDGSLQGAAPLANYEVPFLDLGEGFSYNGIVEFQSDGDCSPLEGQLVTASFSGGQNLIRIEISEDGLTPILSENLKAGLSRPLPLALRTVDGTLFVGETGGGGKVRAMRIKPTGCWTDGLAPIPKTVLDSGSAVVDGKIYIIGGKISLGPLADVHIYDPNTNIWSLGMGRPGIALEDPAVAVDNGFIYVMGGSATPFTGQSAAVHRYDPVVNDWTTLASMNSPRGGATAQAIGGLIYVAGGSDPNGSSLDTVEVYDPGLDMWDNTLMPMTSRRDHPMSAVHGGKMYVFGGRIREADGTTLNGTLNTAEAYDPLTDIWDPTIATMPSGRRTGLTGIIRGKIHVLGGERTASGGAFGSNEAYDPNTNSWEIFTELKTPRQGFGGGVVNDRFYVIGGGTISGSSFSDTNEAYGF